MNNNVFGTDGIRAVVGAHPFTPTGLPLLGHAIGHWICTQFGSNAHIIIGYDTRISSASISHALVDSLAKFPLVIYNAGVLPTPGVASLVHAQQHLSCGIIISASHNPYHDNGIKIVTKQGKISPQDELFISHHMQQHQDQHNNHTMAKIISFTQASDIYRSILVNSFNPGLLIGKTIVLDCANGATSFYAPGIFAQLGAHIITINAEPQGFNINEQCGTLYPEQLRCLVKNIPAYAGFAFDGDGDRVIAINAKGDTKDGDDVLALLMQHPDYARQSSIIGTVMSNQGLEQYVHMQHKKFIRVAVGDKHVIDALQKENSLLGGEPSGHTILRNHLIVGDGILTALKLLETMHITGNTLMQTYTKWPQYTINIPVANKKNLSQNPFASIITDYERQLQAGRLLVRYSGTEPLLRIMVEHEDPEYAQLIAHKLTESFNKLL